MRVRVLALLVGVPLLSGLSGPALAQQTGSVAGVVRDAQGGVLPGVTVTLASDALIGGPRTTLTGETGNYQFALMPPGTYVLTFELPGFTPLRREDIHIQVAQNTRVDVEMSVGTVQESVNVSGAAPVVDVTATRTQTNIDRQMLDSIPTSLTTWTVARMAPGVVAGRLDVGGTEGAQQYSLSAFGSSDSQKSFSVDGLKTNYAGTSGGIAIQYLGSEFLEEYNLQTASGAAESDVGGVYMNMVTKSGGNKFSSSQSILFMNSSLQGNNIDDDLRQRLQLPPGVADRVGNPIQIQYEWTGTLGGPIKRDKVWFFTGVRWWRLDQQQLAALDPVTGRAPIDDNRIRNFFGKLTYQATPNTKTSFMYIPNEKSRFHRRDAPYLNVPDYAAPSNPLTSTAYLGTINRVIGTSLVLDGRLGTTVGTQRYLVQKGTSPDAIPLQDVVRFTRINAPDLIRTAPTFRTQANVTLSYFATNWLGGSHDFKVGVQLGWDGIDWNQKRGGDIMLQLRDGVPFQALLTNTPNETFQRNATRAFFLQDQLVVRRATFNVGVRFDGVRGYNPAQTSPAGTWVSARSFPETEVLKFGLNVGPRLGVSYDLFGNGRTAVKGYYGRFYDQFGSAINETVNPNNITTVQVPWNDLNNNLSLDPGELNLSGFTGFPPGLFPFVTKDARRPYNDEFSVGFGHHLTNAIAVSISYHRRELLDGLTIVDRARPTSAYTPVQRTYVDRGETRTITVYSLDPALRTARNRVITNTDVMNSTYNGISVSVTKKMSNRWQMLGSVSFQKHQGFDHTGTYTNPGNNTDLNNPNYRLNRDAGAVFVDLPWDLKLSGSYTLPHDVMLAANYTARAGDPLSRTIVITGLPQGAETVNVQQRGVDRAETIANLVDVRISKRFRIWNTEVSPRVDFFNLLNVNPVQDQNQAIGSQLGVPLLIIGPRIIKFSISANF